MGFLAHGLDDMFHSNNDKQKKLYDIFTSDILPNDVIDSWVDAQMIENKRIYIEEGMPLDELNSAMTDLTVNGTQISNDILKSMRKIKE